jgi:hypothetical protein
MINQVAGVVLVVFGGLLFAQLALGMFGDATETSLTSPSIPFSRHLSPLLGNAI